MNHQVDYRADRLAAVFVKKLSDSLEEKCKGKGQGKNYLLLKEKKNKQEIADRGQVERSRKR